MGSPVLLLVLAGKRLARSGTVHVDICPMGWVSLISNLSGGFVQIAKLEIKNFRGIREGVVRFSPHTVLVGPNNCGKTTVIEALALLFGRDRMIRQLTEHDFYGS